MLHKKLAPKTRTFSAVERRDLNKRAAEIGRAKVWEEMSQSLRVEARSAMLDTMSVFNTPASVAYLVDGGDAKGSVLCLDLGVRYEADLQMLTRILGDRIGDVTKKERVFNREKAESALKLGIVTEAELAKCLKPIARPSAQLKRGDMAPKGIKPGKGRVTPLKLAKGVKLDWG